MTADERREQIIQAARTEFAARGYAAATTDAIAARAGVSQPYVIRLFGTKQALFLAVADGCFRQVHDVFSEAAATAPPGEELTAMGAAYRQPDRRPRGARAAAALLRRLRRRRVAPRRVAASGSRA